MTTEHTPIETADDSVLHEVNKEITDAYDKRVYTSNAFPFTSPGHIRASAYLWGLDSVPLENARVLELGCAGGGNLLPFAVAYPNAHVVGVDLSSVQVNQGKEVIKALDLKNLHLHAMSLTDITPDFGQFDYIIAHGVFSWVPPEVREAILRILRDNLSPLGIGYISYNTYPGWKAGDIVRDAMLLHSHGIQDENEKLAGAKAMLNLLSDGISQSNPLAPSLKAAVTQLRKHSDFYIAHEYLERFNNPCYLLEFVSLADQYGLTHVGDADPHVEQASTYGQNVQLNHSLIALGQGREMRQQYLDFAVGRNFRKSLIVRNDRTKNILTSPDLSRFSSLRWAGHFIATEPQKNASSGKQVFTNHRNFAMYSRDDIVIEVIKTLTKKWPATVDFDSIATAVTQVLPPDKQEIESARAATQTALQTLFTLNTVRYTYEPSPYDQHETRDITSNPDLVPGIAYISARKSDPAFGVGLFNLWHETVNIRTKEIEQFIMANINGKNSLKKLTTIVRDALNQGIVLTPEGKSLKGQRNLDAIAGKIVNSFIKLLNQQGLLQ